MKCVYFLFSSLLPSRNCRYTFLFATKLHLLNMKFNAIVILYISVSGLVEEVNERGNLKVKFMERTVGTKDFVGPLKWISNDTVQR